MRYLARARPLEYKIKSDITCAKRDLANSAVIWVGDFNLQPADEAKMERDCPSSQGTFQNIVGPSSSRWKSLFDLCAEIRLHQPSHFCSATNCVNKLTRTFVFVGRSVLPMLAHQAGVVNDPMYYHGQGI